MSRGRQGLAVAAALLIGTAVGIGGKGTFALWSDTAPVTTGSLASGSMDLRLDGSNASGLGTGYAKSAISFADLTPGEYKAFVVSVHNVGEPRGDYEVEVLRGSTWSYDSSAISVQAFTGSRVADTSYPQVETCTGSPMGSARTISSSTQSLTSSARRLNGGASEDLCLRIGLRESADNGNQNRTGTLDVRLTLTQDAP